MKISSSKLKSELKLWVARIIWALVFMAIGAALNQPTSYSQNHSKVFTTRSGIKYKVIG